MFGGNGDGRTENHNQVPGARRRTFLFRDTGTARHLPSLSACVYIMRGLQIMLFQYIFVYSTLQKVSKSQASWGSLCWS